MSNKRLIPIILISEGGCYKSIKFNKLNYIGDPLNIAKIFNQKLVDELIILDINASKKNIKPDFNFLEEIASECFMPVSYGGGIRSVEDADRIFSIGFEKIILNNILFHDKKIITTLSEKYGSQSIIVSIDIYKGIFGKYLIFDHTSKNKKNPEFINLIKEYEKLGAGELFINSVKNDGKLCGLDKKLIENITKNTSLPLIISGGLKDINDAESAFSHNVSAVAGGSYFIYHGPRKAVLISYPTKHVEFAEEFFNRL